MSRCFLSILNMSISASWVVLAVLVFRILLRKAPKWITVLLWAVVAIRLICPISIESEMSMIPSAETISPEIMTNQIPVIHTGIPMFNHAINPIISESISSQPEESAHPIQIWIPIAAYIWLLGMALILLYALVNYLRIKRKISTAVLLRDRIYQSENVISPFVLGLIRPKIYIPFDIEDQVMVYVLAHEQAHILRKDHWWKPIGFLLLSIHWFNPLMWLGYSLLCADMELACDEKVIRGLNRDQRADYSQTLLSCSVNRRMILGCPVAFGVVGVKERVKSVLHYKKPAFWVILAAIVVSAALACCFLTNPVKPYENKDNDSEQETYTEYEGVYLSVERIAAGMDNELILNAVWHNETSQKTTIGGPYTVELKDGDQWVDVAKEDPVFTTIAYVLEPNSTQMKKYRMGHFDLSIIGTYRLSTHFSTGDGKTYKAWVEFQTNEYISNVGGVHKPSNGLPSVQEADIEMEQLKAKFPMYFDLPTDKGLEVYIWQMAKNSYSCGLLPGRDRAYTQEELFDLHTAPASLEEMGAIVALYQGEIAKEDVTVCPIYMPHSSYSYTIDDAYREKIENLFWAECQFFSLSDFSFIMDRATFDIDGDGREELCTLGPGPTSGLFTFTLDVREPGDPVKLEYFNIYNGKAGELSFVETDTGMKLRLIPQNKSEDTIYYSFCIKDGNVYLTADGETLDFWGEQGVGSWVDIGSRVIKAYEKTPADQVASNYSNEDFVITTAHYQVGDGDWLVKTYTYRYGFWVVWEHRYAYRLEITGRMPNAEKYTTYIVLSNSKEITFEQAWKASGFSSNTSDYFDPNDAIIVGNKLHS